MNKKKVFEYLLFLYNDNCSWENCINCKYGNGFSCEIYEYINKLGSELKNEKDTK